MYLSRLTLNPRHPGVLRALSDLYAMHRLLWQAFPDLPRREPEDWRDGRPHPLLYRVEPISRDGLVRVLAQSEVEADWNRLADVARLLCSAEQRPYDPAKEFEPEMKQGRWLRYRLRANPVVSRRRERQDGKTQVVRQGLFGESEQAAWLIKQGQEWGFALPAWEDMDGNPHPDIRIVSPGIVKGFKAKRKEGEGRDELPSISLLCVDYEGLLRVTDAEKFAAKLRQGVGPAKGLGFGLLSIGRALV